MKKYQEIQKKTERTGKTVAIISTVAFHAALVVFGVCSGLKYIYPPPPEQSFVIDFSQEEKVTVQQQRRGSAPQTEEPDRTKKINLVQKSEAQELGKKPMLLEFTADWCPNCKFLEATVLTDERLRRWKARYGMELVRVDLTAPNAFATRLCEALGSKSIPVTALFPAGDNARRPVVLRDVYSVDDLEHALDAAFGDRS